MRVALGKRANKQRSSIRLALDVGTEYAKALVVQAGDKPVLLGVGRAQQTVGHMEDGAVAHISGVVACCQRAIEQAFSVAGHAPIDALIGVAGEHVHGSITRFQVRRRRPNRPIRQREFSRLVDQAKREAQQQAIASFASQTGLQSVDVELLNSTLLEVKIDGYKVRSPWQFRGTYVELSLFHTFSPLVHMGALKTIANELGIVMLKAVAEPYALANGVFSSHAKLRDAVLIDIGGGSTDVAVIRGGVITNTQSLAIGGRSFTRSLSRHFSISLDEAECLKLDYSARLLDTSVVQSIARLFDQDLRIFCDALTIGFGDLAKDDPLPANIYLCGGGASLPGVQDMLSQTSWEHHLFYRAPQVRLLTPGDIKRLADPDLYLSGIADVTPKSLAVQTALFDTAISATHRTVDAQLDLA